MGGEGSGATRKRRRLPRKRRDGAIARLDGRATEVRHVRNGVEAILQDRGGDDAASYLARRMAHRCMHLDGLLMRDEIAMITGAPMDVIRYLSAAATWLRYVQALGLDRRARDAVALEKLVSDAWG